MNTRSAFCRSTTGRVGSLALLVITLLSTCLSHLGQAQAPGWNAAIPLGSGPNGMNATTGGGRTAVGPGGSVYAAGHLYGKATFGTLPVTAAHGLYVGRLDPATGQWQWVASAGTPPRITATLTDLAVDAQGRAFVTGHTGQLALPDSLQFGPYRLYGSGFVASISATGQWRWAVAIAGSAQALAVTADGAGGAYVTGSFVDTLTLGTTTLTNPYASYSAHTSNAFVLPCYSFVAHLSASGQWQWVTPITGFSVATAIGLSGQGDVVVGGACFQHVTFGTGPQLTPANTQQPLFLATFNGATGSCRSARAVDAQSSVISNLILDATGNVYVQGEAYGRATFGATRIATGSSFVARLSAAGQWTWAKAIAHSASLSTGGRAHDLCLGANGTLYLGGSVGSGTSTFGNTILQVPAGSAGSRGYLARLNATSGQWQSAALLPETSTVQGLAFDGGTGNLYLTGDVAFAGPTATTTSFGPSTVNGPGTVAYVGAYSPGGQQWQWAASPQGGGGSSGNRVAIDAQGNVTLLGYAEGQLHLGTFTLTPGPFVARRTAAGQWQWALPISSLAAAGYKLGFGVDGRGNVYLGGNVVGTGSFGPFTVPPAGYPAAVASISPAGQWQWVAPLTPTPQNYVRCAALAVDTAGNVTITGDFSDSLRFSAGISLTNSNPAPGNSAPDGFVARLNRGGQWQWAAQTVGPDYDFLQSVATDAQGNVVVAGSFNRQIQVGPTTLTPINPGSYQNFVAYLSAAGQWQHAYAVEGATNMETIPQVAMGPAGDVLLTGEVTDSVVTFGTFRFQPVVGASFAARLSADSHLWQWVRPLGSATGRLVWGAEATMDALGNAYVAGLLNGQLTLGNTTLDAGSGVAQQAAVASLDPAGQWRWATQSAPSALSYVYTTSFAVAGGASQVVMTGSFVGPLTFGATTLPGDGAYNGFLTVINLPLRTPAELATPGFALWPNPTHDLTRLRLQAPAANPTNALVFDGLGRQVWAVGIGTGAAEIPLPLAGLAPGLYLVRCNGVVHRLIVE